MVEELLQSTLFEEDFIHRTTGNITSRPDIALTELIANSWDAGAKKVNITLPHNKGDEVIIEDNGSGMNKEEFNRRWMTLSYNRLKHQGQNATVPSDFTGSNRIAYGRNGVGRHGMLCFANDYKIETWKDGKCLECEIALDSGNNPIKIVSSKEYNKNGHGTKLSTNIKTVNYGINDMQEILSARYLYDPEFEISINGKIIELDDHSGLVSKETINCLNDSVKLDVYIIDSERTATKSKYHGVAFWVNNRLVGNPSWTIGEYNLKDGRTKFAKTHTIIVKSDDLVKFVSSDWTELNDCEEINEIYESLTKYINDAIRRLSSDRIEDTKLDIIRQYRNDIEGLNNTSKIEVDEFINQLVEKSPDISSENLELAVSTIINVQKSKNGIELLKKISELNENDIDTLNSILDNWGVNEISKTLDLIDYRISIIEAISKLCSDKATSELHTLHPLIEQARWIFGPEFDSEEYTSNKSLIKIIRDIIKSPTFENLTEPKKRPDLLIFEDRSLSCSSCDDWNGEQGLFQIGKILIIELKKGGFEIGRDEMNQADGYVQEIAFNGGFTSHPQITAYVVGNKVSNKISTNKKLEDANGKIIATTYDSLVHTANKRLFNLRKILSDKYEDISTDTLVAKVLKEPKQEKLNLN